jgi:diazepam-binding inhibitor (GABA receptor modulator, acyl-CoA-binding protein)
MRAQSFFSDITLARGEGQMSLQAQFDQAMADSKNLPERPDNMTLLKIYALFKQGSTGDVEGSRPGFTDMVGRAKYDAWANLKGTSKEDAQQQYIDLIEELKG